MARGYNLQFVRLFSRLFRGIIKTKEPKGVLLMKKCPVHNCPAKTGCKAAVLVASILGAIAAVSVVLLFVLRHLDKKRSEEC